MLHQWFSILCMLVVATMITAPAQAQSSGAEQDKLLRYEQTLKQRQTDLQQFEQALSRAKSTLAPMGTLSGPELDELNETLKELDEAKAVYDAEPSDDNKARLKNIEFKQALAERKFKKANAGQLELQEQIDKLSAQISQAQSDISKLTADIGRQKATVEQTRTMELATRRAQEAEEQRKKADAAQAEIARLKAQLEQQRRDETSRKAAELEASRKAAAEAAKLKATVAATATTTNPTASVAADIANNTANNSTVPATTATAMPANSTAASSSPASKSTGVLFLSNQQAVLAEQKRLEAILAKPDTSRHRYNKILNIKPINASGESGTAESNTLNFLGNEQYRGEIELTGGEALFVIGFNRWRVIIPDAPKGTFYTVLFDNSDPKNLRLVYYPRALSR